jgi:uncharacterized protein (DUF427 family)
MVDPDRDHTGGSPMTARATWNGAVLAESDETIIVEGNHYFPLGDVKKEVLAPSETHSTCHWKGEASYYDVTVDGEVNSSAAWYYPEPLPAAEVIRDYVAFWHGVEVDADPSDGTAGPNPPPRQR